MGVEGSYGEAADEVQPMKDDLFLHVFKIPQSYV